MSYKLIAFDMDGTLLNSEKKISPATLAGIAKAASAGKVITLSTGRAIAELVEYKETIPELEYVVAMSGALVYNLKQDRIVFDNSIPSAEALLIAKTALKRDVMVQILTTTKSVVQKDCCTRLKDYGMAPYQEMYTRVAYKVDDIMEFLESNTEPIGKINVYHRNVEEREQYYSEMKSLIDEGRLHLELVYSEQTSLESCAIDTTKGTGLKKLCEHLQIDISETIAVGDALNDIDVLKTAGLALAVANAKPEILDLADHVVSDNDHDGCLEAIEKYLLCD